MATWRRLPARLRLTWLLACIGWSTYQAGRAVHFGLGALAVTRGTYSPADVVPPPVRDKARVPPLLVIDSANQPTTLELSRDDRALVLLFDRNCAYCNRNMPRWLELMARLEGTGATVYGIAPRDLARQEEYWRGLKDQLRLAVPLRDSALIRDLGSASIPTTIALRRGRIEALFVGVLSPWQQSLIIRKLQ